jgi:hypothetical protein
MTSIFFWLAATGSVLINNLNQPCSHLLLRKWFQTLAKVRADAKQFYAL